MALADCLRIYDQMMQDFVGSFAVEGNPVLTVFATPDRPFAATDPQADAKLRSMMMDTNLVASVARLDPQYNPRLRVDTQFLPLTKIINNDFVLGSQYPRPYILPYQIDVRCRTRTDANLWVQWVYFKFNPYVCFYPDFGTLWGGKQQIQSILRSIVDTSELEAEEDERWIRWTVNIDVLNAWMFPMPADLSDIPDPFGMIRVYRVVRKAVADVYLSEQNPPVPDPDIPGVVKAFTVAVAQVEIDASVPVESN